MTISREAGREPSGWLKPFQSQPLRTQGERGFNRNTDSRITIHKMEFPQGVRVLAYEIGNKRVGKRTVHVPDARKIQNDLIVGMHMGIDPREAKGSRLFTIREEVPKFV